MSTTRTPIRIESLPSVASNVDAMGQLREGIAGAIVESQGEVFRAAWEAAGDGTEQPDAVTVWDDEVVEATVAEVVEQTARLIDAALARRLPWRWPS